MDKTLITKRLPILPSGECCAPPGVSTLAPERADQLADQLKALADATRLRMLDLLVQQPAPLCVCDITAHFAQHQPTISHHLRLLRAAGLVDCEKRGVWAYYWATAAGKQRLSLITELL